MESKIMCMFKEKFSDGGPVPDMKKFKSFNLIPGSYFTVPDEGVEFIMDDKTNESGNKYLKKIVLKGNTAHLQGGTTYGIVDVYSVLDAFEVKCPAIAHAVKKLLCAGSRGAKDTKQDITEAKDALLRAYQMEEARIDLNFETFRV